MKKSLFVFLLLVSIADFSLEKDNYKKVASEFQSFNNDKNYDAMSSTYNYDTKKVLPFKKQKHFSDIYNTL
ncbi:MAG TPA: hypothetical protein VKY41_00155 [Xanthomarina sp.]|nr:hypothetical protein [Xanthomarina sp.]